MRVIFLTHSFPRFEDDIAGSFLLRLAVALRQHDVSVHILAPAAPGFPPREALQGIPVTRFRYAPRRAERLAYSGNMVTEFRSSLAGKGALLGLLATGVLAAAREQRRISADLLHAHWWFPGGVIGAMASRMSGIPLITTLHGTDVRLARDVRAVRPVFRSVMRRSAVVTTVSNWLAVQARLVSPGTPIEVAPMPVNTARFAPGKRRDPTRVLFVGRLTEQKGIQYLIRALPLMRRRVSLDVVGAGALRSSLEELAHQLEVADRVVFHGARPPSALLAFYQRTGAVVVPSVEEGLGLVAVEALLCGAPLIAAASGGLTDIVQHDVTGVLVPPADPSAIAGALDRLHDDAGFAAALAERGRARALASFAPEEVALQYVELYRRACAPR